MKTYIYTVTNSSMVRGYNHTVKVYRVKNNKPFHVGTNDKINTGSYKGDYAAACSIISECDGHKLSKGSGSIGAGYSLESNNINLWEV